ncbi:CHASE3 domain-containing protein [Teichococcus aestuarii]
MSIANRILLGFTAITLLLVGLGLYSLNQISVVTRASEVTVTRDMAMLRKLIDLQDAEHDLQDARSRAVSRFLLRSLGRETAAEDPAPLVPRYVTEAERLLNEIQAQASQNWPTPPPRSGRPAGSRSPRSSPRRRCRCGRSASAARSSCNPSRPATWTRCRAWVPPCCPRGRNSTASPASCRRR